MTSVFIPIAPVRPIRGRVFARPRVWWDQRPVERRRCRVWKARNNADSNRANPIPSYWSTMFARYGPNKAIRTVPTEFCSANSFRNPPHLERSTNSEGGARGAGCDAPHQQCRLRGLPGRDLGTEHERCATRDGGQLLWPPGADPRLEACSRRGGRRRHRQQLSMAALVSLPVTGTYSASKAAFLSGTRSIRAEHGARPGGRDKDEREIPGVYR